MKIPTDRNTPTFCAARIANAKRCMRLPVHPAIWWLITPLMRDRKIRPGNSRSAGRQRSITMSNSRAATTEESFAQRPGSPPKCLCCGDSAPKSPACPWKDKIDKAQWFKTTGKVPQKAMKSFTQIEGDRRRPVSGMARMTPPAKLCQRRAYP